MRNAGNRFDIFGADGEGRTPKPLRALEPKSSASASSATSACRDADSPVQKVRVVIITSAALPPLSGHPWIRRWCLPPAGRDSLLAGVLLEIRAPA